jgi:hypothetical protein
MLPFESLHDGWIGRRWIATVVGMWTMLGAAARADLPTVVYERSFPEFGYAAAQDIVVDDAGQAYVLGAREGDIYATLVLKLDANGDVLWSRLFDGSSLDLPGAITLDSAGDVYVVGMTASPDFPTLNPLQGTLAGGYDAFVLKLAGTDGTLLYSTYLGGLFTEDAGGIAVNDAHEIYISGSTESYDFPTVNPLQPLLGGYPYQHADAFISKISADGSQLLYSTYFGGSATDYGRGLRLDSQGRMYIAGETESTDFPTASALQPANAGGRDAFAARISADGSTLEYGTYIGGEDLDVVYAVALDNQGRLLLAGATRSIYFPTTAGVYQPVFAGEILGCEVPFGEIYNCEDVFVAAVTPSGTALDYATYLGGNAPDFGYGLAIDSDGQAYVSGHTISDNFPPYNSGTFYTNFITKLSASADTLFYTYLRDTNAPNPARVALDGAGDIYFAGPALTVVKLTEHPGALTGDLNCDGAVNFADINPFVLALADPAGYAATYVGCPTSNGDINADGSVNFGDINPFVALLTG